jgi:hypothetical protein
MAMMLSTVPWLQLSRALSLQTLAVGVSSNSKTHLLENRIKNSGISSKRVCNHPKVCVYLSFRFRVG